MKDEKMIKRICFISVMFVMMAWQLVLPVFAQQVYFIDGYHGGVYGHYPKQYTKFITETLDKNPDWKINLELEPETWDTVQVNEPENYAAFKKYFNDDQSSTSRLEYVNPSYGQAYLYNINGESIIRQFQYGIKKMKQHFPNAVFTSYSSEEPCFTSALPQILTSFGIKYASLKNPNTCWGGYTRAFGGDLVNWVGPDGTKLITIPRYEVEALDKHSTWQTIASTNSTTYLDAAFKYGIANPIGMCLQDAGWKNGPWLGRKEPKYKTTYTTWRNYVQNIVTKKPTVNWNFSQEDVQVSLVWGAQVLQKIAKEVRVAENKTTRAEKLAAMAKAYTSAPYPSANFDEAWRGILLSQHHDCWIVPYNGRRGDTWIDKVDVWTGTADSLNNLAIEAATKALSKSNDKGTKYIRVFNTSANERTELVRVALPADDDASVLTISDKNDKLLSYTPQLIKENEQQFLVFTATVPAMGFATYKMVEGSSATSNHIKQQPDGSYTIESDLYKIIVDPAKGGSIKSIIAKKMNNKEFVDSKNARGFNELRGYFYKDSSYFSSADNAATVSVEANGSQYSKLKIEGKINGQSYTQTIAVTQGQPVIDMTVKIDWKDNPGIGESYKQAGGYKGEDYHKAFYNDSEKLQTLFPLNLAHQQVYKDAPFDVTKSKLNNTFFQTWDSIKNNVMLNWVDVTDGAGKYGMALFSNHTTSYAHGENFPLGLTTQYSGVGLWGRGYSLTMPTELHYAILPHEGKWDAAGIWEKNNDWNNPLTAVLFQTEEPIKDYNRSLISVGGKGLELTAVTMDGNDLLVRFFNAESKAPLQQITFDGKAAKIITEELNGKTKQVLKTTFNKNKTTIQLAIPTFGIRTIRLINFNANTL